MAQVKRRFAWNDAPSKPRCPSVDAHYLMRRSYRSGSLVPPLRRIEGVCTSRLCCRLGYGRLICQVDHQSRCYQKRATKVDENPVCERIYVVDAYRQLLDTAKAKVTKNSGRQWGRRKRNELHCTPTLILCRRRPDHRDAVTSFIQNRREQSTHHDPQVRTINVDH